MRKIGLHIRIPHTIADAVAYAQTLGMPIFQMFLIDQIARRPLTIDAQAQELFTQLRNSGIRPYVHGSYFMNLANLTKSAHKTLLREVQQAQQIGAEFFILHPGSATGRLTHKQGIKQLANIMNQLTEHAQPLTFALENTAHGKNAIGSDLEDFKKLKTLLHHPERIAFCIDTAHAHAYGYDVSSSESQEAFISELERTIGIDTIALIHLNDSHYDAGSHIDKHASLGKGTIGRDALREFAMHPKLSSIPLILELPLLSYQQEAAILETVKQWHVKKEHS